MSKYQYFNFTDDNYIILRTIKRYESTASGKGFKSKPTETERCIVKPEYYTNYITSIPFFNNFGYGAYCRAKHAYTIAGYLPIKVTSVSPERTTKIIAEFDFVNKNKMLDAAGWREREIINNAISFNIEYHDGSRLLWLYTKDTGVTASGCYDIDKRIWRA